MAQRYARIDVDFLHKRTAQTLLRELGPGGPLVFIALILKAKDGIVPGTFTYASESAAWEKLGLENVPLGFTLDEFLKVTGRLKQTSRTPVGRLMNVKLTRYGDWQKDAKRYEAATKKARSRAHSTRDTNGTAPGTPKGQKGGPRSTSTSTPKPPLRKSKTGAHSCPRCPLTFTTANTLAEHLENVHALDPHGHPLTA
jgi:hypothetical protein